MKVFNFQLQRFSDDFFSSLGLVHECFTAGVSPKFWGYSLEDQKQLGPKVQGETRIPAKIYEIQLMKVLTPLTIKYRADKRFKDFFFWHLWLKDVEGFSGVYLHVGNWDGDTDACILMGDQANNNMKLAGNDGRIQESADCYTRFYQYLYPELENGNRAFLRIRDENDLLLP